MIVVFLNNKLITVDTALPLLMEARRVYPGRPIHFFCFDRETAEALRRNVVLWDLLVSLGKFHCIPALKANFIQYLQLRLSVLWLLIWLTLRAIFRKVTLLHFKALNTGPLSVLSCLFPNRTVFIEANGWGYDPLMMEKVGQVGRDRVRSGAPSKGNTIVGFSRHWPEFGCNDIAPRKEILLPPSHLAPAWQSHIRACADEYVDDALRVAGLQPGVNGLVFILGWFGANAFLRTPQTSLALFERTVEILDEEAGDVPIFIKPHIISDMDVVARAIVKAKRANIIVSHLHPAVLATRAVAFVANYYSTTLPDAFVAGVPTVEFTDYAEETLKITNGKSMRQEYVSHFINDDEARLRALLAEVQTGKVKVKARAPKVSDGAFGAFTQALA